DRSAGTSGCGETDATSRAPTQPLALPVGVPAEGPSTRGTVCPPDCRIPGALDPCVRPLPGDLTALSLHGGQAESSVLPVVFSGLRTSLRTLTRGREVTQPANPTLPTEAPITHRHAVLLPR